MVNKNISKTFDGNKHTYSAASLALLKRVYGKHYAQVMRDSANKEQELKENFTEKYPAADMTMFSFQALYKANGELDSTNIWFQDPEERESTAYDITADAFLSNPKYLQYLYWPRGWGGKGKVPKLKMFSIKPKSVPNDNLLIYVSAMDSSLKFNVLLDPVDTSYSGELPKDIRSEKFDYINNPYFTAIASSYVSSYMCGISEEHFLNKVLRSKSHFLTSIARYHFTFHFRRFMKNPSKLTRYMTDEVITEIQKNMPFQKIWENVYLSSGAKLEITRKNLKRDGIEFKNLKFVFHGNMGVSTSYDKVVAHHPIGSDDYKLFVPKKTTGLTRLGQKLFQHTLESYVYSILGAQAKTRWSIVEQGGKSYQTQEVFKTLMNDTLTLDNITTGISNMRQAIISTNVVLNYAVSPGLILIPSDLRILVNPIPGYNNVFTLATNTMSFGTNKNLNRNGERDEVEATSQTTYKKPNFENDLTTKTTDTVKSEAPVETTREKVSGVVESKKEYLSTESDLNLPTIFIFTAFGVFILGKIVSKVQQKRYV